MGLWAEGLACKMPLINLECPNGHQSERYLHTWDRLYQEPARMCECGHPYAPAPSFGVPLTYFRESRPQYIANLEATIRSHGEHVRVMKERGVEPATAWHSNKYKQTDGLKTKAKPDHPKTKLGLA